MLVSRALIYAGIHKRLDIVRFLVEEAHAHVDIRDKEDGVTPLLIFSSRPQKVGWSMFLRLKCLLVCPLESTSLPVSTVKRSKH